jgi:hypothetical protein
MGLGTKTYWLTDRQLQCDFDFDFELRVTVLRSEKLVAEAGDGSGTQRMGNVRR